MIASPATNGVNKVTQVVSKVFSRPAAESADAHTFFSRKLSVETDPSDLYADMQNGVEGFIVIDVRSPEHYAAYHIPGAQNLPHATITAETTAHLDKSKLLVLYCWGPGCNGATKGAMRLSALGFQVKEMIGGIEYWADKEKLPVEQSSLHR
ncbi:MAG TPA: rhodanese-like domain-containing protein [Caldilineaceae bacterium]|nr:rhodanese-like domain-containing protein [Caldilineaceae bacterium]